jgi:hypothetical protein
MTTDELKKVFNETRDKINQGFLDIKKSNLSDQMKIEYMEKMVKMKDEHLLATANLAFTLNEFRETNVKQIDILNKKMDWLYYDRDCAVYQIMSHLAYRPDASEQDKLAFSRAVYPSPPKHERT